MQHQNSEAPTASNNQGLDLSATLSESTDMKSIANSELNFHGTALIPVTDVNGIWLTSADIAKALGYKSTKSISNLFAQYEDEFSQGMTMVIESVTNGINGSSRRMKVRVFSLRGAHLIAMFARTPVAKEFRRWVLDILDREVEKQPELTPFYRYKARLELRDDMTGETYEILGQAQDMRQVAFGLANDLGYRPNAFTHVPVNEKKLRKIH